ncbi:MAG TPA: MarR family transcriptional regulator [Candidatus Dormibacteraeota bacterium]
MSSISTVSTPATKKVLHALADLLVLAEPLQLRLWESGRLTVAQLRVLRVLSEQHDPLAAGRLAALAGISQASLSRLLGKLEVRDLVHREIDPEDRRRVGVVLTPQGRALLAASRLWRDSEFEAAAAAMSAAEREAFAAAVGAFSDRVRLLVRSRAGD